MTEYLHSSSTGFMMRSFSITACLAVLHLISSTHSAAVGEERCSPNPCENGGTCRDGRISRIICDCPTGFSGRLCQIDRRDCTSCDENACDGYTDGYYTFSRCHTTDEYKYVECAIGRCFERDCPPGTIYTFGRCDHKVDHLNGAGYPGLRNCYNCRDKNPCGWHTGYACADDNPTALIHCSTDGCRYIEGLVIPDPDTGCYNCGDRNPCSNLKTGYFCADDNPGAFIQCSPAGIDGCHYQLCPSNMVWNSGINQCLPSG